MSNEQSRSGSILRCTETYPHNTRPNVREPKTTDLSRRHNLQRSQHTLHIRDVGLEVV